MQLPYSEELNIEYLGRLFDNTSECYKFFWFKAILTKVTEGNIELTYEELVDEMIADAWYMVTEYHLNLGPKDTLEGIVNLIKLKNPELKSSEKKSKILEFLRNTNDKDIIAKKRILTLNVPYRLQAPFMKSIKGKEWDIPVKALMDKINQEKHLLYYFTSSNGLMSKIVIQDDWYRYITKNQEIIKGWLEYKMIDYIQRRNPSVPGISDKLHAPEERKLNNIKKYWKLILEIEPVREIYHDELLSGNDISIDHFIPWSYVAHDEMWNLNPTTRSINSSKSNNLPDWDRYFNSLVMQEYKSYELMWKYESIHKEFNKCAKEHINSDDIRHRVYRQGISLTEFAAELEALIKPVYLSAKNCGFGNWIYEEKK